MNTLQIISPVDIDSYLKEALASYLNGQVTEEHLARLIKREIRGKSTKLSFKVVDLLPEFNNLLEVLQERIINENHDRKISYYVLQKLAHKLYMELL